MKAPPNCYDELMFEKAELDKVLLREEVYTIVGAAIEVHRELGCGFLEAVYQEALEIELRKRAIPFVSQKQLEIFYKGQKLIKEYLVDLLCYQQIIVELKAMTRLTGREESQIINYLKGSNLRVVVLINFGSVGKLDWKRFVR